MRDGEASPRGKNKRKKRGFRFETIQGAALAHYEMKPISLEETYNSLIEEARKRKEIESIIGTEKIDETIALLQKIQRAGNSIFPYLRRLGREKGLMLYRHVKDETTSTP